MARLRHSRHKGSIGSLPAALAIVGVRTQEHAPAAVVGHDLVQEAFGGAAERANALVAIALERMVLEIERNYLGIRRDRVDALFPAGAEQLQRGAAVHFRIVELRG